MKPVVTVPGHGRVERAADLAATTFVVEVTRPTAADARAAAAEAAAQVLDALAAAGVGRADLRTAGLDVQPAWDHEGSRPVRRGFTVAHRIGATVRDLDAVGRVVDAGLSSGATGLDGVEFRLGDPGPAAAEARALAVRDALGRATIIAEAAGMRLGALRSLGEGGTLSPAPRREMRMMAMAADALTPVLPGRIEVVVDVVGEWELATD